MDDKLPPLRGKHKAFVDAYFNNRMNATAAYREVYQPKNNNVAAVEGHRILSNPKVQAHIKARMEANAMTADEWLAIVGDIARSDMGNYIKKVGRGFAFDLAGAIRDNKTHLIKSITKGSRGTRIEILDPLAALRMIAPSLGISTEKSENKTDGELLIGFLPPYEPKESDDAG